METAEGETGKLCCLGVYGTFRSVSHWKCLFRKSLLDILLHLRNNNFQFERGLKKYKISMKVSKPGR